MQMITKRIYYFFKGEPDKDLTSLLRISIKDRESGLRNSFLIELSVGLIFWNFWKLEKAWVWK